jgi:phosphomevalonate kinase
MKMSTTYPRLIVLISGKRKCGKDYIASQLCAHFNTTTLHTAKIVHLSAPIKHAYAQEHHLDYQQLMSDGEYKEQHRAAMVDWSERMRVADPDYFCRLTMPSSPHSPDNAPAVLIVADCRRPSDLAYFARHFSHCSHIFRLRIHSTDVVRHTRGFVYTEGIDDCATECALDDYTDWHMTIDNNSSTDCVLVSAIMSQIERYL